MAVNDNTLNGTAFSGSMMISVNTEQQREGDHAIIAGTEGKVMAATLSRLVCARPAISCSRPSCVCHLSEHSYQPDPLERNLNRSGSGAVTLTWTP